MKSALYLGMEDDRALLFVDILGFKNVVEDNAGIIGNEMNTLITDFPAVFCKICSVFDEEYQQKKCIRFFWGSDTIVVSAALKNIGILFKELTFICDELLRVGLFTRGAITIGKLYHKENMWGPALSKAAELEKSCAKFPRVVFTKETFDELQDNEYGDIRRYIYKIDSSNLHYFSFIEDVVCSCLAKDEPRLNPLLSEYISRINDAYKNTCNDKHRKKVEWVIREIRRVIEKYACDIDSLFKQISASNPQAFIVLSEKSEILQDVQQFLNALPCCQSNSATNTKNREY